jgi:hypothetical protein
MSTRASSSTRMTTPRTPIPHHIDSITKKTKYIDPAHRECVPNFQAASFTPKLRRERYHGRTHNCITTFKMTTGDLFAVCIFSCSSCPLLSMLNPPEHCVQQCVLPICLVREFSYTTPKLSKSLKDPTIGFV